MEREQAGLTLSEERWGGDATLLGLLDLSVASETINHGVLREQLRGWEEDGGTGLQWFHFYLQRIWQETAREDNCLEPQPLDRGAPQRSILPPVLFNVYMKPLESVKRGFGAWSHQHAEGTRLSPHFPLKSGEAV